jgi:hypothetical protein
MNAESGMPRVADSYLVGPGAAEDLSDSARLPTILQAKLALARLEISGLKQELSITKAQRAGPSNDSLDGDRVRQYADLAMILV